MMAILHTIKNLKNHKCLKKIDNYFFNENINHYINAMTGHRPNTEQSQEFLSTMHTMIDDLDTISSAIDEHTYIRLVNGLQRLYNIHNSSNQSPSSVRENWYIRSRAIQRERYGTILDRAQILESIRAHPLETLAQPLEIETLVRHYQRVNDISGVPINDDVTTINSDANTISDANTLSDANVINSDANVMIRNDNVIIDNNNNNNNNNNNENNDVTNQQAIYTSYVALYSNAFDYWNQPQHRFRRTN